MAHLIVTRFNVAHRELRDWPVRGLDADWLDHRLPLFEHICAPSVAGQESTDFRWLVFVHPETPRPVLRRIESALPELGQTVLSEAGTVDELRDLVPPCDLLVTTRLDNDDALSRSHAAEVRSAVDEATAPFFINFPVGCQMGADGRVTRRVHRSSPFLSYVERVGDGPPTTVWGFGTHVYLDDAPPRVQVHRREPMWLQGIHDRNVANPAEIGRVLTSAHVRELFAVDRRVLCDTGRTAAAIRSVTVPARIATGRMERRAMRVLRRVRRTAGRSKRR